MKRSKGPDVFELESLLFDVAFGFAQGESISELAKRMSAVRRQSFSRQKIATLLQMAFQMGIVQLAPTAQKVIGETLQEMFPNVKFRVISARFDFNRMAGIQLLSWMYEVSRLAPDYAYDVETRARNRYTPHFAFGGGLTLHGVVFELKRALQSPECYEIAEYFRNKSIRLVNATAGGHPSQPEYESSFLTCLLGQYLQNQVGILPVSGPFTQEEQQLTVDAYKNTLMVISGVSEARKESYYIKSMLSAETLSETDLEKLAGEFLYHPFTQEGQSFLKDSPIRVKESWQPGDDKTDRGGTNLATLFHFESLKGREVQNRYLREGSNGDSKHLKRYVATFVRSKPESVKAKALALLVLLRNGFLTHVCMTAEVARALVAASQTPIEAQMKALHR